MQTAFVQTAASYVKPAMSALLNLKEDSEASHSCLFEITKMTILAGGRGI